MREKRKRVKMANTGRRGGEGRGTPTREGKGRGAGEARDGVDGEAGEGEGAEKEGAGGTGGAGERRTSFSQASFPSVAVSALLGEGMVSG